MKKERWFIYIHSWLTISCRQTVVLSQMYQNEIGNQILEFWVDVL